MPTAHHGGIEALLDYGAGAGLDHGFPSQQGISMSLLVEIGLYPIGLFLGEEARLRVRVRQAQSYATR